MISVTGAGCKAAHESMIVVTGINVAKIDESEIVSEALNDTPGALFSQGMTRRKRSQAVFDGVGLFVHGEGPL